MVRIAKNKRCDTFICYRSDIGSTWGRDLFEWMGKYEYNPDRDYGEVYYSEYVPNANFLNDIRPMLYSAKNIIIVVTNKFTEKFPEDKESFESDEMGKCIVTACEIYTIMERFRDFKRGNPSVTEPRIYALHVGGFNDDDKNHFYKLANYCITGNFCKDYNGTDVNEKNEIQELVNTFVAAGIHTVFAREFSDLLNTRLRLYLKDVAILKHTVRYCAARAITMESPMFRYIEQNISVVDDDSASREVRHIKINELSDMIVNNKLRDTQGRYGRFAILSSDGGMGKTTQLKKMCAEYQRKLDEFFSQPSSVRNDADYDDILKKTVILYIPAKEMNKYPRENFYDVLARYLGFHKEPYDSHGPDYSDAKEFLNNYLFNNPYETEFAPCLLCIDGLDEVGSQDILASMMTTVEELLERGVACIVSMRGSGLIPNTMNGIKAKMDSLEDVNSYLPEKFRPNTQSRLFKLLRTPFYFTMYYETVTSRRSNEASSRVAKDFDSLFRVSDKNGLEEKIYYHPHPETPGELIWNYIARHIYNVSQGDGKRNALNYFYLMCVLPRLAVLDRNRRNLRSRNASAGARIPGSLFENDIKEILDEAWNEFRTNGWCPFWSEDYSCLCDTSQIPNAPTVQSFFDFCVNRSSKLSKSTLKRSNDLSANRFPALDEKILRTENTVVKTYEFMHSFIMEAFVAIYDINDIVKIGQTVRSLNDSCRKAMQYNACINIPTEKLDEICKKPIFAGAIKRPVMKLISEICAEREGTPRYDKDLGLWVSDKNERNDLVRRTLSILGELRRLSKEAKFCISEEDREKISRLTENSSVFVHNLFEILKLARSTGNELPDMSGVKFNDLDMTKCDMTHIVFSHHSEKGKLCADFKRAYFDPTVSFSEGHRAVLRNLKIASLCELNQDFLLSVDETGYVVLTDLRFDLTVCTLSLRKNFSYRHISNAVRGKDGIIWIACENELFGLEFKENEKHLYVSRCIQLPTRSVAQLVVGKDNEIYYHPVSSPLDRFRIDGTPVWELYGRWFDCAIVNQDGTEAYCVDCDENYRIGYANRLVHWTRDSDGKWKRSMKEILSNVDLLMLTKHTFFQNAKLAFSEDEKKLLLSLYCNGTADRTQANDAVGETMVIEINCDQELKKFKIYSVMGKGYFVSASYYGSNERKYFSSYLSICVANKNCESRQIRAGTGFLSDALFMPDTKSFLAVTNNPIRIQEICCEDPRDCRCVRQIVPSSIRSKIVCAFAFRFEDGLKFTMSGHMGYSENLRQLRLVLWYDNRTNVAIDLSEGRETDECLEDMTLIRTAMFSYGLSTKETLSLVTGDECVRMIPYEKNKKATVKINIHPEWLFAGCDFTGAEFCNDNIHADLKRYICMKIDMGNNGEMCDLSSDEIFNEELSDSEDVFEDEYTEDDYSDE